MIRVMKRMCNMRMREYCCSQMMAMTMKGSVYIIIGNEQKRQEYEKDSIYNSIGIEPGAEQRLGRG